MIEDIMHLPEPKRALLEGLVERLGRVEGVAAIVLGGSYASGTQHAASDMDVGLYYFEARPFSIDEVRRIAQEVSVNGTPTVTDLYGWGPWVNGGAWIHTSQGKVDYLYRNVDQIRKTIAEAHEGISQHDYDQQPAYGFYSVIYLAETEICIPLYDPEAIIAELKRSIEVYPPLLKQAIVRDSLWSAEFTLLHARNFAAQGDVYNTVGCLTRAAANLTQALFALNEKYFLRDKRVLETVSRFSNLPAGYLEEVNRILACPGRTTDELKKSVAELERAWQTVVALPGADYEPRFQM